MSTFVFSPPMLILTLAPFKPTEPFAPPITVLTPTLTLSCPIDALAPTSTEETPTATPSNPTDTFPPIRGGIPGIPRFPRFAVTPIFLPSKDMLNSD